MSDLLQKYLQATAQTTGKPERNILDLIELQKKFQRTEPRDKSELKFKKHNKWKNGMPAPMQPMGPGGMYPGMSQTILDAWNYNKWKPKKPGWKPMNTGGLSPSLPSIPGYPTGGYTPWGTKKPKNPWVKY